MANHESEFEEPDLGKFPAVTGRASDGEEKKIHNEILLNLPANEARTVVPTLEFGALPVHHVLHEPGDTLKSAYFLNSGIVSILSVFPNGKTVEANLIGKEGFVGSPLIVGFQTANTRAIIQIQASVFRIDANKLKAILSRCTTLSSRLNQFSQVLAMEVTQVAACNQLHEVHQRLARRLLMTADRVDSTIMPFTQESLANALGVRRSSLTIAAGRLEREGLISNSRAKIQIVDRPKLETAACECYGMMRKQMAQWRDQSERGSDAPSDENFSLSGRRP